MQLDLLKYLLVIAFGIMFQYGYGSPGYVAKALMKNKDWSFVENKGQLGPASQNIAYYGHEGGAYLFCVPGKISFAFAKIGNCAHQISEANGIPISKTDRVCRASTSAICRADLILLNSNPNAEITASDQQEYYENFYGANTGEQGITHVHTYKTVTYKNIYPHIDMLIHVQPLGLKYEFIVYQAGKTSDIQLQWDGVKAMTIAESGGISYQLRGAEIKESTPISFQGSQSVASSFVKQNNCVSFHVGRYDKTMPLTIDPTLIWGTFWGGLDEDFASDIATDRVGNIYVVANTSSPSGIATLGEPYNGSATNPLLGCLAKYNSNGKMLWATYYGDSEVCDAVATDAAGNVLVTGGTVAKSGIATPGAHQERFAGPLGYRLLVDGAADVFLAKFNSSGICLWGTYYGGKDGGEAGYAIATDAIGNAYITGFTGSTSGIATSGSYQSINSGGPNYYNGGATYLAKFGVDGSLLWATYFGYPGIPIPSDDEGNKGYCVAVDPSGNVYFAGSSGSKIGVATPGSFQPNYSENSPYELNDGFLAKFNSLGTIQWATYYGDSNTVITGLKTDNMGNVYLIGNTYDTSLATTGAYHALLRGGQDVFLSKFSPNGARLWSTYFGGSKDEYASGIAMDGKGDVFICGITKSDTGIATAGAYKSVYTSVHNPYDNFLAAFTENGQLEWASYYGESGYPQGMVTDLYYLLTKICADIYGNVYMAGIASDDAIFATKDANQRLYGGGSSDAFLARFSALTHDAGIDSFISPPNRICQDSADVKIRLHNYGTGSLDSLTLFLSINNKTVAQYHWTGSLLTDSTAAVDIGKFKLATGTDNLKAWAYHPDGVRDTFNFNDTATLTITVYTHPKAAFNVASPLYLFQKDPIGFSNLSSAATSYFWNFGDGDSSQDISPDYTYADTGNYKVSLIAKGPAPCPNDTLAQLIHINSTTAKIYVPNSFSPNDDLVNDVFDISGFAIRSYTGDIFSRWGQHICHFAATLPVPTVGQGSLASGTGWDGNYKGAPAPMGTYIYQFDVIDIEGNHHKLSGNVTLVR